MRARKQSPNMGALIFSLFFIIPAIFIFLFLCVTPAYKFVVSSAWKKTPANLQKIELKRHYKSNTTTYSAVAEYSYQFDGEIYRNTRVGLSGGNDNLGDYWRNLVSRIKRDAARNDLYAYVNPSNPQDALLDRTFRWRSFLFGLLGASVFGIFGGGLFWYAYRPRKTLREKAEIAAQGIRSNERNLFWIYLGFGGLFVLVSLLPLIAIFPLKGTKDIVALGVIGIFMLVGLGVIIAGLKHRKRFIQIGDTPLFLDPNPGSIGGHMGGYFDMSSYGELQDVEMTLSCTRQVGSGERSHTKVIWQEETGGYVDKSEGLDRVRFIFPVPEGLPYSVSEKGDGRVSWTLTCDCKLMSAGEVKNITRSWPVLMQESKKTSTQGRYIPKSFFEKYAAKSKALAKVDAENQITYGAISNNMTLTSDSGRSNGLAFGLTVVGLIFAGVGIFTLRDGWIPGYIFALPGYIFALIGSFLAFMGVFLFGRRIDTIVNFDDGMVFMARSWYKMPLYSRNIAITGIDQFKIKETSSSTQGNIKTEYFAVYANNGAKEIKIAEGIEGRDVALAVIGEIQQRSTQNRD